MDRAGGRYPWRWRLQHLLRGLPFERSCSADVLKECWLFDHLPEWNKALRAARLALTEFEPSKLCLRSYDVQDDYMSMFCDSGNQNDGAFLVTWLPRQHHCIRVVRVHDREHIDRLSFMSSTIVGPAPNLQRVVLHPRYGLLPEGGFLQAFGPPKCLRDLDLTNIHVSDALAPQVAEVLRENGPSLHRVMLVGNLLSPESAGTLLLALVACERLEDLTFEDSIESSACDAMAEAFKSNRVLRKLSLVGLSEAGIRCKHPGNSFTRGRRVCLHCLTDLFAALMDILSFRHLTLERTSIGDAVGESLAQFVIGHRSIQTLSLQNCSFHNKGATYIAEALPAAVTLEHLKLHGCSLEAAAVRELCWALPASTTLRSLILPEIISSSSIINAGNPTFELLGQEFPGRIQFYLLVDQPPFMSAALAHALRRASKVKICHGGSGVDVLSSIYASLALNNSLRSLYIDYEVLNTENDATTPGTLMNALCAALKSCGSLQTVHLDVHRACGENQQTARLLAEVFETLKHSPHLRKLSVVTYLMTLNTAQSLSVLVDQSRSSLVELHIVSTGNMSEAVLGVLHETVTRNVFLSQINVRCPALKDLVVTRAAIDDAKEHNLGLLNKAAQFVMGIEGKRTVTAKYHRASAFDELRGTAALQEHLVALSGKSEPQVSLDVKKARCYLQDNYLIYAGIVRAVVLCEPGDGSTQLNALDVDCWRSIAQFLKLSDVVR